ncbi:PREDICTED: uricase-like [Branchiostoma belcheri]|uniref:Uricase n=1 Tax=Branchiostoma belcheri TaxID=7741 RepID=A0A6P5A2A3_BRABE|nr:PREDICTED: uricase-like [Branchiostoma belcheri]XP_019643458.1 PREDICTED: uricase-like [Branchiostoma belcheri]
MADVEFTNTEYGKNWVRLLHIRRLGGKHQDIRELEVCTSLTLDSKKDYLHGDNSDIIATDTQKNTVYALAKTKGVTTPEQFGLDLCHHFLSSFSHVTMVKVDVTMAPWRRIKIGGQDHAHAFIMTPDAVRFCHVEQARQGPPVVHAGLKDMKILKTTQSGFTGFLRDRYTSLPDAEDRCLETVVYSRWRYSTLQGLDFDAAWNIAKSTILEEFAGPPSTGAFSASVQKTLYDAECEILGKVPQISEIEMTMPNVHNFTVDMSKFGLENKDEVLMPVDKPSGNIHAAIRRKTTSKL